MVEKLTPRVKLAKDGTWEWPEKLDGPSKNLRMDRRIWMMALEIKNRTCKIKNSI
jgi:hypothetical protein